MSSSAFARAVLSVLALTVTTLGVTAVSTPARAAAPGAPVAQKVAAAATPQIDTGAYEKRVRRWINRERQARGLRALSFESCTDRVAERWGRFLAVNSAFYHQSMGKVLSACDATYAAETLAKGPVGPRQTVKLWMNSPGHRAILLSKSPRRIGIGAYPDSTGTWVVAANFTRF